MASATGNGLFVNAAAGDATGFDATAAGAGFIDARGAGSAAAGNDLNARAPIAGVSVPNAPLVNAMTVDVEDWFQVQAFAGTIPRANWDGLERRVQANTEAILEMFARANVRATFFTLGWVAERHAPLVRAIVAAGHELASHGYWHQLANTQTPAEFAADVGDARRLLEDTGGVAVLGYRAPTFSINARNPWAFDVLADAGYRYSSSVYPIRHDLYGMPAAPRMPFTPDGAAGPAGIVELPMTTLALAGRNLPCAGGGYFRLLPYGVFRAMLRRFNRAERAPGIFYTHPWEIDAGQPRVTAAPAMARFRHYLNLADMPRRMGLLLRDFRWGRVDEVFAEAIQRKPSFFEKKNQKNF